MMEKMVSHGMKVRRRSRRRYANLAIAPSVDHSRHWWPLGSKSVECVCDLPIIKKSDADWQSYFTEANECEATDTCCCCCTCLH